MMPFAAPAVSIVMPLYNKEGEVLRAVASVQAQTVTGWELVVVNDGSTDRGPARVRALGDPHIRVIDQENGGVSVARNRGIQEAGADLIAFLDADDEWSPDFLETILGLRERYPECAVFATRYRICRSDGVALEARIRGLPDEFAEGEMRDYFCIASHSDPPLWSSAVAVTRQAMKVVGGFPAGIASGEDLLTWARLALRFRIAYSMNACATFYMSGIIRTPAEPDRVGMALAELYAAHPETACLRRYVALWHRMRMMVLLRLGETKRVRAAFHQMARYSGRGAEYLICLVVAYSPPWLYRIEMRFWRFLLWRRGRQG